MPYDIIKPFGPSLYKTMLDSDFIDFLKIVAEQTKNSGCNVGSTLAGNISEQYSIVLNEEQTIKFHNQIRQHIFNAVLEFEKKYNIDNTEYIFVDTFKFHLGSGPWINFQHHGEFNPLHNHTGQLSAIIYIDVPKCIAEENASSLKTNAPSAGKVSWVYGNLDYTTDYHYTHQPVTGEMFLFPAGLQHTVYPFKSDVERISMSFNVYDISA